MAAHDFKRKRVSGLTCFHSFLTIIRVIQYYIPLILNLVMLLFVLSKYYSYSQTASFKNVAQDNSRTNQSEQMLFFTRFITQVYIHIYKYIHIYTYIYTC